MRLLLDTHLLLWASESDKSGIDGALMSDQAANLIDDLSNDLYFSTASVWEVAIKFGRGRANFGIDPAMFRQGLLDAGYSEVVITGEHAAGVAHLPPIHKDPFDRLLVSQARAEGLALVTSDAVLQGYPGRVMKV